MGIAHASDLRDWHSLLPGLRLTGMAKPYPGHSANVDSIPKNESLQTTDQCVERVATTASSWMFAAGDCWLTDTKSSSCHNKWTEVPG